MSTSESKVAGSYSGASTPEHRSSLDFKMGSNAEKGDALGDKDVRVMRDGSGVGTTHRGLTARHITFIGIGGGIGTVSLEFILCSPRQPRLTAPSVARRVSSSVLVPLLPRPVLPVSCCECFASLRARFDTFDSIADNIETCRLSLTQRVLRCWSHPLVCHGVDR